mmetsp:Transcript_3610/g.7686  ORF Transcript_3610/g.7686 Transcript_3610/m.7686 type:complete len:206 (+) Transcript_3610:2415-3032(+)
MSGLGSNEGVCGSTVAADTVNLTGARRCKSSSAKSSVRESLPPLSPTTKRSPSSIMFQSRMAWPILRIIFFGGTGIFFFLFFAPVPVAAATVPASPAPLSSSCMTLSTTLKPTASTSSWSWSSSGLLRTVSSCFERLFSGASPSASSSACLSSREEEDKDKDKGASCSLDLEDDEVEAETAAGKPVAGDTEQVPLPCSLFFTSTP